MHHLLRSAPFALAMVLTLGASAADRGVDELSDVELIEFFGPAEPELPVKCGTPHAVELQARNLELASLAAADGDTLFLYTPEGHFRIAYRTEGTGAVDPTDVDLSGVPDYVEMIGRAFERSWSVEIDSLGFTAPDLGGERYRVSAMSTSSYFGVTWDRPESPGGSEIWIRYSMEPYCRNEVDPGDCEVNLLLATVAHEFKHAIHFASGWNLFNLGGSWIELDATWIEDLVYDDSNDYYRYLESSPSPFTRPDLSLASNNDYRYCTWQHYLGERYGYEFMLDLSDEIASHAGNYSYHAQNAYPAVASDRGLDWEELWRGYTEATYLSGDLAAPGRGFSEAAFYPTSAVDTVQELPQDQIWVSLPDMSMRFHYFDSAAVETTGTVDILFEDIDARGLTLLAVFQRPDETVVVPIPLVDGSADFRTAQRVEDYDSFAVVVGNPRVPLTSPSSGSYKLTLGLQTVPTARSSVGRFKGRFRQDPGG